MKLKNSKAKHVEVLGGGISGFTTAIELLDQGYTVSIVSGERLADSTSAIAAAVWHPFFQENDKRFYEWAKISYQKFMALSNTESAGIVLRVLQEFFRKDSGQPWWADISGDCTAVAATALPEGYAAAYRLTVPIADTTKYLTFIENLFFSKGGEFDQRWFSSFDEFDNKGIVVNCTGVSSRRLANDPEVYPTRGNILVVPGTPSIRECMIDDNDPLWPTYIIPRLNDCIIGGTAHPDQMSTIFPQSLVDSIVARCTKFAPSVAELPVVRQVVGFRPSRKNIRLEIDRERQNLIHNYGHGGSGFTVSWGCAVEVRKIVDQLFKGQD